MIAIACVDENWGIGKSGDLLFHIKKDMESFKRLTENGIVIMGRRTWESLPKKPLPNRINIVVTSDDTFNNTENTYFVRIEDVMNLIGRLQKEKGLDNEPKRCKDCREKKKIERNNQFQNKNINN